MSQIHQEVTAQDARHALIASLFLVVGPGPPRPDCLIADLGMCTHGRAIVQPGLTLIDCISHI